MKKVIEVERSRWGGPWSLQEGRGRVHTPPHPHVGTQGAERQETQPCPHLARGLPPPENRVCCFSCPVCGALLWWPPHPNTGARMSIQQAPLRSWGHKRAGMDVSWTCLIRCVLGRVPGDRGLFVP